MYMFSSSSRMRCLISDTVMSPRFDFQRWTGLSAMPRMCARSAVTALASRSLMIKMICAPVIVCTSYEVIAVCKFPNSVFLRRAFLATPSVDYIFHVFGISGILGPEIRKWYVGAVWPLVLWQVTKLQSHWYHRSFTDH